MIPDETPQLTGYLTEHERKAIKYYENFAAPDKVEDFDIEDLNLCIYELQEAKKMISDGEQYLKVSSGNGMTPARITQKLKDIDRFINIVQNVRESIISGV